MDSMGGVFVLISLWVLSCDSGAVLTLQRRADLVRNVQGTHTSKTHKVFTGLGKHSKSKLKNEKTKEMLTGIHPSGVPVKGVGDKFSKKDKSPLTAKDAVQPDVGIASCPPLKFWHPTYSECHSLRKAGSACPANSSCCLPGLKQIGDMCKAVMCNTAKVNDSCKCNRSTECDNSCCRKNVCRNCTGDLVISDLGTGQGNTLGDMSGKDIGKWPKATPRPFSKFCKNEHGRMGSPVNKSCCESSSDCAVDECCVFQEHLCDRVCKRSCEGELLIKQPKHCQEPSTSSTKVVKCKSDSRCGKGLCCVKTKNSKRGICGPCDPPTLSPLESFLAFFEQYNFLQCSGLNNSECPIGMTCSNELCTFPSCPGAPPSKESLKKYEKDCCKDRDCGEGRCCRVFYNSSVAVCHPCGNDKANGRSLTQPNPPQRSCRKKSECNAGMCCVALVPRQGKVCSTCDSDPAVTTRDLDKKEQKHECNTDFDCDDKKCCVLTSKGNKRVCRKKGCVRKSNVQLGSESIDNGKFSNGPTCKSDSDCRKSECCTLVANSPNRQSVCKPCLTVSQVRTEEAHRSNVGSMAQHQGIRQRTCLSDDDCSPRNGSTFCCADHPSRNGKHCVPRGRPDSVCIIGNVSASKYTCSCQTGLICLPVAMQQKGLEGIGVCSGTPTPATDDGFSVLSSKEAQRLKRQKQKHLDRKIRRENRKKEKAKRKGLA